MTQSKTPTTRLEIIHWLAETPNREAQVGNVTELRKCRFNTNGFWEEYDRINGNWIIKSMPSLEILTMLPENLPRKFQISPKRKMAIMDEVATSFVGKDLRDISVCSRAICVPIMNFIEELFVELREEMKGGRGDQRS